MPNIFCHICSHCVELFLANWAGSAYCSYTSWTNMKLFIRNVLMDGMKAGISRHISSGCIQGSWHTGASCEKNGSTAIIWKTSAVFNGWPQIRRHPHSCLPGTLSRCPGMYKTGQHVPFTVQGICLCLREATLARLRSISVILKTNERWRPKRPLDISLVSLFRFWLSVVSIRVKRDPLTLCPFSYWHPCPHAW